MSICQETERARTYPTPATYEKLLLRGIRWCCDPKLHIYFFGKLILKIDNSTQTRLGHGTVGLDAPRQKF